MVHDEVHMGRAISIISPSWLRQQWRTFDLAQFDLVLLTAYSAWRFRISIV